jgi:leader peptidase (prepilin peptidase)/N-methyltransferase
MADTALWFIVLWLFALGGVVGSFLNVVVYRLPLGISIVYPPSRCPKCGKLIRWYDNVPIFGWMALGGRCRQCHNPISARYPIVEAITASLFAAVAYVEIDRLGTTYPFHLLLLGTLLCAGLIEYDGNRPPPRLFLPALAVGLVVLLNWPGFSAALPPAVDRLLGLLLGALLGGIRWRAWPGQKPLGLLLCLVCVGLFLGVRALAIVAVATAMLELLVLTGRRRWPWLRITTSMLLGMATLGWILAFNRIVLASL